MSLEEGIASASPLNAALEQGVAEIARNQEITFTLYVRLVLPIDGTAYWVRADLVSQGAIANAMGVNETPVNQPVIATTPAPTFTVKGSLHYSAQNVQNEDESFAINRVVFTSESPIEMLNTVRPSTLWIGSYKDLTFAFSTHAMLYEAAGIWHYQGDAIYPDMEPQIIDKMSGFSGKQIVSNSLPIWLSMNNYAAMFYEAFGNSIPLYPSYLLPANITPPWGTVHIEPGTTQAVQSAPLFDANMNRWQLAAETARVTLYGLDNEAALNFADFVQQYALNTGNIGISNMPVPRDEKRTQSELGTISQKKSIEFDVTYYQARANEIAREVIEQAIPTYFVNAA